MSTTAPVGQSIPRRAFVTTHWSVVLAARDPDSPESAEALEKLCRAYWYPLYAHARWRGSRPQDAEDLTQEFFVRLLRRNLLESADRERGRFRSFLRVAFERFMANEWERARAQKRGGGLRLLPLDTEAAECRYQGAGEAAGGPKCLEVSRATKFGIPAPWEWPTSCFGLPVQPQQKATMLKIFSLAYTLLVVVSACIAPLRPGELKFYRGGDDARNVKHLCYVCGKPATGSYPYTTGPVYFCGTCTPPKEIPFWGSLGRDKDHTADHRMMQLAFLWTVHATGLVCGFLLITEFCFGWRFMRASSRRQQVYLTLFIGLICSVIVFGSVSHHSRTETVAPARTPVISKSSTP